MLSKAGALLATLLLLFTGGLVPVVYASGVVGIPCPTAAGTSSALLTINASAYDTFTIVVVAHCRTPLAVRVLGDLSYGSVLEMFNTTVNYVNFTSTVEMTQAQLVFIQCNLVAPSTNFLGQFVYFPDDSVLKNLIGFAIGIYNSTVTVSGGVAANNGVTSVALISIGSGTSSFSDGTASSILIQLQNVAAMVTPPSASGTSSSTLPVVAVRFRGVVAGLRVEFLNVEWQFVGAGLRASLVEFAGELSQGFAIEAGASVIIANSNISFQPIPGPLTSGGQNCYVASFSSLVGAAAPASVIVDNSTIVYGSSAPYSAVAHVRDDSGSSPTFFFSLTVQRGSRITLPSSLASLLIAVSWSPQSFVEAVVSDSHVFGPLSTNDPVIALLAAATSVLLLRSRLHFDGIVTLAGLPVTEIVSGGVKCLGTATLSVQNTTITMVATMPAVFPVRIVDYSRSGATDLCGVTNANVQVSLSAASRVHILESVVSVVFVSVGPLSAPLTSRLYVLGSEFIYRGATTVAGAGSSAATFSLVAAAATLSPFAVAVSASSNVTVASASVALLTGVVEMEVSLSSLLALTSSAADVDLFGNVNGTIALLVYDHSYVSIRSNFSCRGVYRAASDGGDVASAAHVRVDLYFSSIDLNCPGVSSPLPTALVLLSRSAITATADSVTLSSTASSLVMSSGGPLLFGDAANISTISVSLTGGSRLTIATDTKSPLPAASNASGLLYLRASNNTLQQVDVFVEASLIECVGSLLQLMDGAYLPSGERVNIVVKDTRVMMRGGGDSTTGGGANRSAAMVRIGTSASSQLGPPSVAAPQYLVLRNVTIVCNHSGSGDTTPATCALVAMDLRVATVGYWVRVQAQNVTVTCALPVVSTPSQLPLSPPFAFLILLGTVWSTTPNHPLLAFVFDDFFFLSPNITSATVSSWLQFVLDTIPVAGGGGVAGPLITATVVNCSAFYGVETSATTTGGSDLRALHLRHFVNTSHALLLQTPMCVSDVIGNGTTTTTIAPTPTTTATTFTPIPTTTTSTLSPQPGNDNNTNSSATTTTNEPLSTTTTTTTTTSPSSTVAVPSTSNETATPTPPTTTTIDEDALALFVVYSTLSDVSFIAQVLRTFPSSCPRVVNSSTYNASATTRTILCSFCLTSSRDTVVAAANRGQLPFVVSAAPATRPPSAAHAPPSSSTLSAGAIAGVVIGSIVGAAAIGAVIVFCVKKRRGGSGGFQLFSLSTSSGGERRPVRYDDDFVMAQAAGVTSMHSMMEELLMMPGEMEHHHDDEVVALGHGGEKR